jgi:hypothetical protein
MHSPLEVHGVPATPAVSALPRPSSSALEAGGAQADSADAHTMEAMNRFMRDSGALAVPVGRGMNVKVLLRVRDTVAAALARACPITRKRGLGISVPLVNSTCDAPEASQAAMLSNMAS